MKLDHIRNFCIIAHIDHGKSTLADRLLEATGAISMREARDQYLDGMDLERERGITIKAHAVTLSHRHEGRDYILNLIDTPGHVDFAYEVSRSLAACEGAFLLIDAVQGIEAQTVANLYLAMENDLTVVPVLNKIDLAAARIDEIKLQIDRTLGLDASLTLLTSAKTGRGVDDVLRAAIERIPAPEGDPEAPLRAMVFDAVYDEYRGIIVYVKMIDGRVRAGDRITFLGTSRDYTVDEVGIYGPQMKKGTVLAAGEVGYLLASIKNLVDVRVGDSFTTRDKREVIQALPGYEPPKHMVYCGIYPVNQSDFTGLRQALDKLHLNDASFSFAPETSEAMGFGFRCGFLGMLHMDIVQERLERESGVNIIQTAPNVTYEIIDHQGTTLRVDTPAKIPEAGLIRDFKEPYVALSVFVPSEQIGAIMQLNQERRGIYRSTEYLGEDRAILHYEMPLAEIIYDYYDILKSSTRGYGTMDYHLIGNRSGDLVRLRILVNGEEVDALSCILHREQAESRGRAIIQTLRKEIPRHMFEVPLQAAIGGKVIARETIRAMRKNVTAKCYGGDITRKRKLLEKQKEGKKRMKQIGSVEIPQKAFLAVLSSK